MKLSPPRVTIGIPTINRSRLAVRAIRSALGQTYPDIEVLVSDDVSTDDTLARIAEIEDARLVLYRQPKRLGLVANFDFCLRNACGEFFLLLGDDDVLLPNAIEQLLAPFTRAASAAPPAKSIGLAWCPCRIANAEGTQFWNTEGGPVTEKPAEWLAALWAGNRGPRLSSILTRTSDAVSVGGYQQRHGDLCDIGNYGQVALLYEQVACVPDHLVQYTNHHSSTTSQSAVRQWQDWARVVHEDLVERAVSQNDLQSVRLLKAGRRNFVSGITLTVLIQTIGKAGWVGSAVREAFRSPAAMFTPYMFRRLWKDGWKVLLVRKQKSAALRELKPVR